MDSFTHINGLPTILKDPNAVLDYTWDFTRWIPPGDVIVEAVPTATGGLTTSTVTITSPKVVVWVSGGNVDTTASVTLHITTQQGRVDDRTLYFDIRNR